MAGKGKEKQRKTEHLNIRVTPDEKEVLETAAERDGRSLSSWIIRAALKVAREKGNNRS